MAIVQISKIQQRSGNLVDLPQLDEAEFGWASDAKRLFVGKTTPNENIEVLTSYSNISFSQINGSDGGNFNISNPENGQVLTYVASTDTWENFTGSSQLSGGKLQLGDVSNITMTGPAGIGYILETDGTGNLSWTPKGSLYTEIIAISNATPMIMTVDPNTPYTNRQSITISGVTAANANTIVNGLTFFVELEVDYPTSGNVSLYEDSSFTVPADGTNLGQPTANGIATAVITSGGGSGGAGGSTNSIQYNSSGIITGDANLVWDFTNNQLTVSGNANVSSNVNVTGNINVARQVISTIATGTAPLVVTSTTRVANLDVAKSGIANTVNDAAQPNITSVGTLTSLGVNGTVTAVAFTANTGVFTGNGSGLTALNASNISSGTLSQSRLANASATVNGTTVTLGGSATITANTTQTLTFGNYLTGTSFNGGTANTIAVDATSAATASKVVARDANGSFAGNVVTATSLLTTDITAGANITVGNITGNWSLTTGSRLLATYADLAEYYEADQSYEPGTVLQFGGNKEVTIAEDGTTRVAGVVSTDPAYVMNSGCEGNAVAIALQGRVPTKVRGTIRKGDMMISGGNGFARPAISPVVGTVIGKALQDFDGIEGIIEVAVGRL